MKVSLGKQLERFENFALSVIRESVKNPEDEVLNRLAKQANEALEGRKTGRGNRFISKETVKKAVKNRTEKRKKITNEIKSLIKFLKANGHDDDSVLNVLDNRFPRKNGRYWTKTNLRYYKEKIK